MAQLHYPQIPTDEHGTTLIELLIATVLSIVVILGLFQILEFATTEESQITEKVQANRLGRLAMANIVEKLHSSCTGLGADAIQGPSSTPEKPLAVTGPRDLWFLSTYGTSAPSNAVLNGVVENDIHWEPTGKSNTGLEVGKLIDYSFASSGGFSPNWKFNELKVANATERVLATYVIPPTVSGENTIFTYYKYASPTSTELQQVTEKISTTAEKNEISKVGITFSKAPEEGSTKDERDRVASFNDGVLLRFNPSESGAEAKNEPCT
jgi:Tfp pilus assembly protein PilV